ncbi:MAG TPA: sensor domain-containing diguanylate cyclase [Acidobacteriaceae bacterium]|nr:sensor domain-containing diguanylate cyclase [Acidobacteriaceae bacterium]
MTTHIKFPEPQQHRELQVLHDVARTLTSSLDLEQVLRTIMQQMAQFFHPETWSLLMIDDASQELFYAAGADGAVEQQRNKRIPMGEGIPGWVARHGEPLIITNPETDPRFQEVHSTGSRPAETVVCLPLRARARTHGVIELVNCKLDAMRNQDMFFLHAMCDYAAIAIQNARAMEQIQKLTITDDCTGLYNSRHLYEMLEAALERSNRKHQPVSLIFLDLDRFKKVNDTHGHLMGSKLLAEVGKVIRNNIGPMCTAFRYGGDEFVVLLPNMGKESTVRTAQHLLETLHGTQFLQEADLNIGLEASFGVATAPDDGRGLHEIIRAADAAMYGVKNSTRNAVGAAGSAKITSTLPINAQR